MPVNLLGFVPFGFLVCLRLLTAGKPSPRGCLFLAVALGFVVSLAIELTQVWLPGRDSSLMDLTMNTVEIAIGGAIAFYLGRVYGKLFTLILNRVPIFAVESLGSKRPNLVKLIKTNS